MFWHRQNKKIVVPLARNLFNPVESLHRLYFVRFSLPASTKLDGVVQITVKGLLALLFTLKYPCFSCSTAGDLFPGQNPPRKVDEELEHFVVKACEVTGNHPDDLFCLKVILIARTNGITLRPVCVYFLRAEGTQYYWHKPLSR